MNKVLLIGNLTKDPEHNTITNGTAVCKFSVAVNRRFANSDGNRECDFFNIVTWRGLADNCGKYLSKGKKVAIVGQIQNRSYDASDGTKRHMTEVIADEVEFLTATQNVQQSASGDVKTQQVFMSEVSDENLPF